MTFLASNPNTSGTLHAHPITWGTLGHEVGGHDVLRADPGLLNEIGTTVYNAVAAYAKNLTLASVWKYWISETVRIPWQDRYNGFPSTLLCLSSLFLFLSAKASDVLGTLHYGPHFVLNLVIFFAALNLQNNPSGDWMRFTSNQNAFGQLDVHPTVYPPTSCYSHLLTWMGINWN